MFRSESAALLMLCLYFAPRPRVAQLLLSGAFLPLLSASHLCFFLSPPPLTVHLPPLADSSLSSLSLIARLRASAANEAVLLPQVSGICRCCFIASDFIHFVAGASPLSPIRDRPCPELPCSPLWFFMTSCLRSFLLVLLVLSDHEGCTSFL